MTCCSNKLSLGRVMIPCKLITTFLWYIHAVLHSHSVIIKKQLISGIIQLEDTLTAMLLRKAPSWESYLLWLSLKFDFFYCNKTYFVVWITELTSGCCHFLYNIISSCIHPQNVLFLIHISRSSLCLRVVTIVFHLPCYRG